MRSQIPNKPSGSKMRKPMINRPYRTRFSWATDKPGPDTGKGVDQPEIVWRWSRRKRWRWRRADPLALEGHGLQPQGEVLDDPRQEDDEGGAEQGAG